MYTVVVGVDGSPAADAAVGWAVEEARTRGGRVIALMAYTYLDQRHLEGEAEFDPGYSAEDAQRVLDASVQRALEGTLAGGDPEDVEIERRVVLELPARALLDAAADADLLVVGSRGRGGFTGLLLGSVSQQMAMHAPCPVVIHRA